MDIHQKLIKKNRIQNSKVTINDKGLRTVKNWNEEKKKKLFF